MTVTYLTRLDVIIITIVLMTAPISVVMMRHYRLSSVHFNARSCLQR